MKLVWKINNGISLVSEWTARICSWLVVFVIAFVMIEVVLRYLFNAPTKWSYDMSYMTNGVFIAMGLAYVTYHRLHIRVDILYRKFTPRNKLIVDTVLTLLIFLPFFSAISWVIAKDVLYALRVGEKTALTCWYVPTAPYKILVFTGFFLCFVQGLANFFEDIYFLFKGGKEA